MSSSSVLLHISIFVAQVILAGVFGIAGFAKVVDRSGSRQALRDFGVPARLSGALGTLLPVAELIIAGALLVSPLARWGAIAALALLVLFAIGISTNLMQGRKPDCHCFGQLHSKPIGWPTLVRNGLLAAIAGMLVWQGPVNYNRTLIPWVSTLTTLEIVAFFATVTAIVVLIAEGWLLQQLWRQNGRLLLRMEKLEMRLVNGAPGGPSGSAPQVAGLPIGVPAPSFRLTGLDSSMCSLDALLHAVGKPLLYSFPIPTVVLVIHCCLKLPTGSES